MYEIEVLLRIEAVRQKIQYALDTKQTDLSIQLVGALMQDYETLYRVRREIVLENFKSEVAS
jgi:hypothetical protein